MRTKVSLKAFPNKYKSDGLDKFKIYLRIIVNRKKAEYYIGSSTSINDWDHQRQRSKNNRYINEELASLENEVNDIVRRLQYEQKQVTANAIKRVLLGDESFNVGLLEFYDKYTAINKITKDHSAGTVEIYNQTRNHLANFIKSRGLSDISIKEINYSFIKGFDSYLKTHIKAIKKVRVSGNTIYKHHSRLKTILLEAIREEHLKQNPYDKFAVKKEKVDHVYLEEHEIELLKNHDLGGNVSLQKVRDIFLFSCYTGLRYSDASDLKISNIKKDPDGTYWIRTNQKKTEDPVIIPLFKCALEMVEKYSDSDERKVTGSVLPKISNQKLNTYLKSIATLVGIEKNITHHVARHTFATTILTSNDVDLATVGKFLGHTSLKSTQIYAEIGKEVLKKEMKRVEGEF